MNLARERMFGESSQGNLAVGHSDRWIFSQAATKGYYLIWDFYYPPSFFKPGSEEREQFSKLGSLH